MLSVIYTECHYAECHYAECHYAECHYAECHYAECHYYECHYAECHYAECHYAECRCATQWHLIYLTEQTVLILSGKKQASRVLGARPPEEPNTQKTQFSGDYLRYSVIYFFLRFCAFLRFSERVISVGAERSNILRCANFPISPTNFLKLFRP
jgi:hypothetical protein